MGKEVKVQLKWQCFYKAKKGTMFSRDNTWTNAAKMGQEEWYERYVRPFHPELSLVGMLQFWGRQFLSAPVTRIGLPTVTFTRKCTTGLHLLQLRSQSKGSGIKGL